ncbi:MAG: DUF3303 family protein [Planctomycetes bacterium]|nr:DUF3303 family protein [Planctomycetota bacterium]
MIRSFRAQGRMTPEGVRYVASWVTTDLTRCFQVMECADRGGLDRWLAAWQDLVDFEAIEVLTSEQAAAAIAPRL